MMPSKSTTRRRVSMAVSLLSFVATTAYSCSVFMLAVHALPVLFIPSPLHLASSPMMPFPCSLNPSKFKRKRNNFQCNMKYNFSKEEIQQQQVMDVREIMDLLKQTYETSDGTNNNATQKWIKTRKYLYQYRARTSQTVKNTNPQGHTLSRTRKRTRGPLTLTQIHQILSFLQTTFPNHSELQAKILQNSPRILSQHHSIESRLIPTVEFLKGLYGGMPCSNGEKGGMFHEAIGRNTDLLLVRGVGYAGGGWEDQRNKDDGHELWRETDDNDSMKVEEYLRSELELTSSSIAKLKRNHPTLFQLSLANKVKPVVHHLFSLLGSSTPLEQSTDAPAPISSSLSKQKKQVAKILANHPTLFFLDVRANLEPTAQFLQDSFKLNDRELATIIASTPGVLGLSLEKNLKPTIQYLWDVLKSGRIFVEADEYGEEEDASTSCLRKCVLKHPQILALSLNNIRSKVFYFDEIDRISFSGMDDANVNAINIIRDNEGQSGVDNDKLSHLGETDGASLAARILMSAPSTYSLSLKENIVPKINYLWKTWSVHSINIDETQLATECVATGIRSNECSISERLREYPQILTLSMEGNIQPTLSFYNITGYVNLDEHGRLREAPPSSATSTATNSASEQKNVIRSRYIAASLYNRLLPRWHFLLKAQQKQMLQHDQQQIQHGHVNTDTQANPKYIIPPSKNSKMGDSASRLPPLHLLAGASDDVFCRQMGLSLTDYLAFKEEAMPRLKFNSQFDRWLKTGRPIDAIVGKE